jgi:hypothetical protein
LSHLLERASSGRAKCRACTGKIAAGDLRFGERLPNPFADDGGEMTHWYHPACAAFRRPEAWLELDAAALALIENRDQLTDEARLGIAHRRLPRVATAEHAPTGRATCRACRELIEKGAWRIGLDFYQDGRFSPGGFVHARCATTYFETADILVRLRHFSPALTETDLQDLQRELRV